MFWGKAGPTVTATYTRHPRAATVVHSTPVTSMARNRFQRAAALVQGRGIAPAGPSRPPRARYNNLSSSEIPSFLNGKCPCSSLLDFSRTRKVSPKLPHRAH